MMQVSKERFFAVIGPMNVNPRVDVSSFKSRVHVSHWEHGETREIVGRSETSMFGEPTKFFLTTT